MPNLIPSRDPYPDFVNQYFDESRGIHSNYALTPIGLIEQAVDLITCGAIRQQRQDKYEEFKEEFASKMMKAIDNGNDVPFSYELPKHIKFEHLKHKVTITKNHFEAALIDTHTRIEVQPRFGDVAVHYIEDEAISNFYTIKMLILNGIISEDKIRFMENGALDLRNANFYKKNLAGINLSNANLKGVNFARTNLTNAKLDHACVDDADFTGANLESMDKNDTDFSKAIMNGVAEMQSTAQMPIMYSRCEKYREDTIVEICKLIKNSYQRDQSKKRSPKSDGLFRTTSHAEELKFATQAFNNKTLDLKNTPLSCLTTLISNEFTTLLALRADVAEKMVANPKEASSILFKETNGMPPIEKKLFSILLKSYSDAYKNADDEDNSRFNKNVVLLPLTRIFLEPIMLNKTLTPVQAESLKERIPIMLKELLTNHPSEDNIVKSQKKKQPINFIKDFWPLSKRTNK